VLYFDNLSRDTSDAYLADGLTEELIARLTQIARLSVKSRNAVRRYRGAAADDPGAMGRALGASYLVSGSVRSAGGRLRVTVTLMRATTGVGVWAEQYDRSRGDLLALEEDIAREVSTRVAGQLLPDERVVLGARPTRSAEAYDRFLRGNFYLAQRNPGSVARAAQEYEAAVRLDPGYVQAMARIPYAYALFLGWGWDYPATSRESLLARGISLADEALRRDPASSDAWMSKASLLSELYPRTLEGAGNAFERAITLDPRNAEAYHEYGWTRWLLGDDSGAVGAYRRAITIEPERAITLEHIARLFFVGRRYRDALRWADSALALDPDFAFAYEFRARMRLATGDVPGALADAETSARHGVTEGQGAVLALVEHAAGDTVRARARLEGVLTSLPRDGPLKFQDAVYPAMALIAFGDLAHALDILERVGVRGASYWSSLRSPEFDPIREHPRFARIVQESRPPGARP
jgi:TolB-like protein